VDVAIVDLSWFRDRGRLGQGKICQGSRSEVEEMVTREAGGKRKMLIYFSALEPEIQVLGSLGTQLEIEINLFLT